jgi:H+/gluconate symporter-like permease
MEAQFTTLGAIVGLVIAIVLIIKKVQPAYSLILGALGGKLAAGDTPAQVVVVPQQVEPAAEEPVEV